jgi:hypothetical protein
MKYFNTSSRFNILLDARRLKKFHILPEIYEIEYKYENKFMKVTFASALESLNGA